MGDFSDDDALGIQPPRFVHKRNRTVYREWVTYFKRALTDETIVPTSRRSSEFIDALCSKSRDNYVLTIGGAFFSPVKPADFENTLNDLFEKFVGDEPAKISLRRVCDDVVKISLEDKVESDKPVPLKIVDKTHSFKFHYVVPNGAGPFALFQRVDLEQESSVNSATLMFRSAIESGLERNRCGALVFSDRMYHPDATEMLGLFGKVVDVQDRFRAVNIIRIIAGFKSRP